MERTNNVVEPETTVEQSDDSREVATEDCCTPWETFHREIDAWARHALATNGFGDY